MNNQTNHITNGLAPIGRPYGRQQSARTSRGNGQGAMLTPRQTEIARLVTKGLSDKEIGHKLHLTEETVGWHLKKIFLKWKIHARAALVARFLRATPPKMPPSQT